MKPTALGPQGEVVLISRVRADVERVKQAAAAAQHEKVLSFPDEVLGGMAVSAEEKLRLP